MRIKKKFLIARNGQYLGIGKVTECSNKYAITTDGLGEALKRSSASMRSANNTLEETVALITAANNVTQDPKTVGNALKTVSINELVA